MHDNSARALSAEKTCRKIVDFEHPTERGEEAHHNTLMILSNIMQKKNADFEHPTNEVRLARENS